MDASPRSQRVNFHNGHTKADALRDYKLPDVFTELVERARQRGPGLQPAPDTTLADVLRSHGGSCWQHTSRYHRGDVEARSLEPSNPHGARLSGWSGACNRWSCGNNCAAYRVLQTIKRICALPREDEGLYVWEEGDEVPANADARRYARIVGLDGTVTRISPGPGGDAPEALAETIVEALLGMRSGYPGEKRVAQPTRGRMFVSVPDDQETGQTRAMVQHALARNDLKPTWRGPRSWTADTPWHPDEDYMRWESHAYALKQWEAMKQRAGVRTREAS